MKKAKEYSQHWLDDQLSLDKLCFGICIYPTPPPWVGCDTRSIFKQYLSKVKLATIVEGYLKAPFLISTIPRCRGGWYSFPWIAPLYTWPYLIVLTVKQGSIKYHFWVFGMTQPGIEPRSPRPLVNTLTIMPNRSEFRDFPSPSLVAISRLKIPVCPTNYIELEGEYLDSYFC